MTPADVEAGASATGVWEQVVDQPHAVSALSAAAQPGARMTHAWLVTGPPGSGRSTAARAFAAALLCPEQGCGTCATCRAAMAGGHADVQVVATEHVFLRVDDVRPLIQLAQQRPASGQWRIIIIEDADRLNESSGNVLLKAIEEPPPRTVWLLCAPSAQDVLVTIRSRCRHVALRIPSVPAVTELLVRRDGIDAAMAAHVARIAGSHVGIARRLARDENARNRRREILLMHQRLTGVPQAVAAAEDLVAIAKEESTAATAERDAREREELLRALGAEGLATLPPAIRTQVRALEENQKRRATRASRDVLDRALVDLLSFYRDILLTQLGVHAGEDPVAIINVDMAAQIDTMAVRSTPELTVRRMDAIDQARHRLAANVAPLLAVEALMVALVVDPALLE